MVADGLAALTDPKAMAAPGRGSYLVPTDTVIGVVAGSASVPTRCAVLVWHEVVNDTVGGVPIVVTLPSAFRGIAVFDRRPLVTQRRCSASAGCSTGQSL